MGTESNSSVAALHNIRCMYGDTFKRVLRYWQDEAKTIPVDITADEFTLQVLSVQKKVILSFVAGAGLFITSPNILTLEKTADEMHIGKGNYTYYMIKTLQDGTVTTIMQGNFIIEGHL